MPDVTVLVSGLTVLGWLSVGYSVLVNSSFLGLLLLAVVDFHSSLRRADFVACLLGDERLDGGVAFVSELVAWALLVASVLYSTVLTLAALPLEEFSNRRYCRVGDLFAAVGAAVLENLGYRQLTAWWRVCGSVEAWRNTSHHWGHMQRRGLGSA